MNQQQVFARSAIEALRSGVPSPHAVDQLGTTQIELKESFESRLQELADGHGVEPLYLAADFGYGKSHLLHYLKTLAAKKGFVTSLVVVSPEMPPGNPHVVLKALAEAAEAPKHTGRALRALASNLRTNSSEFANLRLWSRDAGLDQRFPALMHLYEESSDEDLRTQILGDYEGDSMSINAIRQGLKGQVAGYALKSKRVGLLAHDRIRLLAQFYKACGASGWIILFDELERFTRFPVKQRISVWEELGWWSQIAAQEGAALLPVFAGQHEAIKKQVEDDEPHFRARNLDLNLEDDPDRRAMAAMQLLKKPARLTPLDTEQKEQINYRVKAIYEEAYGTTTLPLGDRGEHTSIRSEIRYWITCWDLNRYYPTYTATVGDEGVQEDTSEADESVIAEGETEEVA